MSTHQGFPTIQILVGPDKESPATREARGVRIGAEAPKSALYQTVPEVKDAVNEVAAETALLREAVEDQSKAEAALEKARTTLAGRVVSFDRAYGVLAAVAVKHCTTEIDATSLALAVQKGEKHALDTPLGIEAKYNARKDWIYIHVLRAPGTSSLQVEVSTDKINWHQLDGDGAIHTIKNPDPGTYWIRALSRSARATSGYTTEISVIVR